MIELLLGLIVTLMAIIAVCAIFISGTVHNYISELIDIKWELKLHTIYWEHFVKFKREISKDIEE